VTQPAKKGKIILWVHEICLLFQYFMTDDFFAIAMKLLNFNYRMQIFFPALKNDLLRDKV